MELAALPSPLAGFARHLLRDQDAVAAALQLPWSNGMVEGQVHRLKLIKRQMYGRASFDLLRLRVLQSVSARPVPTHPLGQAHASPKVS